jgi:hypothetical protein
MKGRISPTETESEISSADRSGGPVPVARLGPQLVIVKAIVFATGEVLEIPPPEPVEMTVVFKV